MLPFRMNPPPKQIQGTGHFLQRCEERLANSSNRTKKKFRAVYDALASSRARTVGLHGKYAVQFGGTPYGQGDYLVVSIVAGNLDGFLSLLVDQSVLKHDTAIIPAARVLPLDQGGTLSNPNFGGRSYVSMTMVDFFDGARGSTKQYDALEWRSAIPLLRRHYPSTRTDITVHGFRGTTTTRDFDEAMRLASDILANERVVNVALEEPKSGVRAQFEIQHLEWLEEGELD